MGNYKIRFLQDALAALEEIVLYIASDNRAAALRMHDAIVKKAGELAAFPRLGRSVPDAKMRAAGYRMLLIKPYIAFYRVIADEIFIYRVVHGTTDYPMLYERLQKPAEFP